jgi:tetratricopeptide (TPR) repeat protein
MVDFTLRGQCELALARVRAGEAEAALARCRRILAAYPKHVATYSVMGQALLALGECDQALSMFRRVLCADPEQTVPYAGIAVIYEQRQMLEEAIWQMERAFELSPGNPEIRRELARMYGQRDLTIVSRIRMTRGALARAYLREGLYAKASIELAELLAIEPYRFDLQVALALAYWQNGHLERASAIAQRVVESLPYCLQANLLLGRLWLNTDKEADARACLQLAQDLDPENNLAQQLFGADSPLPPRSVRLASTEEDLPPIDLPYALEDEAEEQETMLRRAETATDEEIQAPATAPAAERADQSEQVASAPTATDRVKVAGEREGVIESAPQTRAPRPAGDANAEPFPSEILWSGLGIQVHHEADSGRSEVSASGLSLIDVQRQYVHDHAEDHAARLDLARWLRDVGDLSGAAEHYAYLIENHNESLTKVTRDLELLTRFYPRTPVLERLLRVARERARQAPPTED